VGVSLGVKTPLRIRNRYDKKVPVLENSGAKLEKTGLVGLNNLTIARRSL
jgi:hypothetical protein